jgi:hypothetical protein
MRTYEVQSRNGYHAVDFNDGASTAIAGVTRKVAEVVAGACNDAYRHGCHDGRRGAAAEVKRRMLVIQETLNAHLYDERARRQRNRERGLHNHARTIALDDEIARLEAAAGTLADLFEALNTDQVEVGTS